MFTSTSTRSFQQSLALFVLCTSLFVHAGATAAASNETDDGVKVRTRQRRRRGDRIMINEVNSYYPHDTIIIMMTIGSNTS